MIMPQERKAMIAIVVWAALAGAIAFVATFFGLPPFPWIGVLIPFTVLYWLGIRWSCGKDRLEGDGAEESEARSTTPTTPPD